MRAFYIKLEDKTNYSNLVVYEELQQIVVDCMINGKYLILNFDMCEVQYTKKYDANLKEFYGKKMLSPFMWNPKLFFQHHCWFNHLNKEYKKMDKHFRYFFYSKIILDSNLQENEYLNLLEKRFGFALPLSNLQVLIVE